MKFLKIITNIVLVTIIVFLEHSIIGCSKKEDINKINNNLTDDISTDNNLPDDSDDYNDILDDSSYEDIPVSMFKASNLYTGIESELDYTYWFYSKWDNIRYLFLPSTANKENLVISYISDDPIYLNDKLVTSNESTDLLNTSDIFKITINNTYYGRLKVMKSNLGCIYLSTSNGSIDVLDNNKNLVETGKSLMINEDGEIEYNGEYEKLTSRGNSSWQYSDKKPYNLKLSKKENLFGMGKAKKWALVSNYLDHSMLRNKITDEMAKYGGMEFTMDSVFVDLYIDGSYRGTYELYERVEIDDSRVDITDLEKETEKVNDKDLSEYKRIINNVSSSLEYKADSYKAYDIENNPIDITGGYILEFQQSNRYGYKVESGFVTSRGQAIEISSPEYATAEQVEYIRSFVQDMEDAIYGENGYNSKGKHYTDYLDLDSLVVAYLVEEISQNIDATYSSFYMYKDSDLTGKAKMHFGPSWDHDFSYNNYSTFRTNGEGKTGYSYLPDNLFVSCFPINGVDNSTGYFGELYKDESFIKKVALIYFDRFEPFLKRVVDKTDSYLLSIARNIQPSADMNNMRWHTFGGKEYLKFGNSSGKDYMDSVGILRNYIELRMNYLSLLWMSYID